MCFIFVCDFLIENFSKSCNKSTEEEEEQNNQRSLRLLFLCVELHYSCSLLLVEMFALPYLVDLPEKSHQKFNQKEEEKKVCLFPLIRKYISLTADQSFHCSNTKQIEIGEKKTEKKNLKIAINNHCILI